MNQVPVVHIDNEWFFNYEIKPDDYLIGICLRFGHKDWRKVYNLPINEPFRQRFPDPDQIDFINPVNLLIPLAGVPRGGTSRRGAPIGNFLFARIKDELGRPISGIKMQLINATDPFKGTDATTDDAGDFSKMNPGPDNWFLVSSDYELIIPANVASNFPVQDVETVPHAGALPDPTEHFQLIPNQVNEVVALRVFYIICPMCGRRFKTVRKQATPTNNTCPNDGFNLFSIENEIIFDANLFLNPVGHQLPDVNPTRLTSRGTEELPTAHGKPILFWDETRFLDPEGGDYTLWGRLPSGSTKSVTIKGRASWGAGPLIIDRVREYKFHGVTRSDALRLNEIAYLKFGIPSNENLRLRGNVLKWMTIHHTVSADSPNAIQTKHQAGGSHDTEATSDIGYHYIIDKNGTIYEGRVLGIKGSHTVLYNSGNIGIAIIGNYQPIDVNHSPPARDPFVDTPSGQTLAALTDLVDVLAMRFDVKSVWSHRERKRQSIGPDAWTYCPGDNLIPYVEILRNKYPGPPK